MKVKLFEFAISDFEEVYVVIDEEKQRLHISPVNYSYSLTLDLTRDLGVEIENWTKYGDTHFNERVRQVAEKIINELNFSR